jgi:MurNAc alpha-1-phosphate uridylyltransferase
MVPNPDHNPDGDFCLEVHTIARKHSGQPSLTYSGLGVFQSSFFAGAIPGKQALRPFLERAIDTDDLFGELWEGCWTDVGTPERLAQLHQQLANQSSGAS